VKDARLPRVLEEFDFAESQHIPALRIRALAEMTARLSESWEDKRRQVACCPRK
jgi:hypothetical protein